MRRIALVFLLVGVFSSVIHAQLRPRYSPPAQFGGGYLVAAADAPQHIKDQTTYDADGTADDVTIQAAIDAAGVNGAVYLSPGTFTISATVSATAAGAAIIGSGRGDIGTDGGTIIQKASGFDGVAVKLLGIGNRIEHLKIQGNDTAETETATSYGLQIGDNSNKADRAYINDVWCHDHGTGVRFWQGNLCTAIHLKSTFNGAEGVLIDEGTSSDNNTHTLLGLDLQQNGAEQLKTNGSNSGVHFIRVSAQNGASYGMRLASPSNVVYLYSDTNASGPLVFSATNGFDNRVLYTSANDGNGGDPAYGNWNNVVTNIGQTGTRYSNRQVISVTAQPANKDSAPVITHEGQQNVVYLSNNTTTDRVIYLPNAIIARNEVIVKKTGSGGGKVILTAAYPDSTYDFTGATSTAPSGGSVTWTVNVTSATPTVSPQDYLVVTGGTNAVAGIYAITAVAGSSGAWELTVSDASTNGSAVTALGTGSIAYSDGVLIDGAVFNNEIDLQYDSMTLVYDGSNFYIVSKFIQ